MIDRDRLPTAKGFRPTPQKGDYLVAVLETETIWS
jgi:hypothetical protein